MAFEKALEILNAPAPQPVVKKSLGGGDKSKAHFPANLTPKKMAEAANVIVDPVPDSQPYSYLRVAKAFREKDWDLAKGERAVHEDLLRAGYSAPEQGILSPLNPRQIESQTPVMKGLVQKCFPGDDVINAAGDRAHVRKAMGAFGDDTLGGALVQPTLAASIIDLLRPQLVMKRAGAQVVELPPSGQLIYGRQTADPTFYWLGENTTITASDPTLGNITLSPKRAAGLVEMSNDSLRYTSPAMEMVVRNALAKRGAVFLDQAYIAGPGSTFAPRGVINYSGLTSHTAVVTGTDGNTFSPDDVSLMIGKMLAANGDMPTAFIMHPTLWAGTTIRRADAVTTGDAKGTYLFQWTAGDADKGIPEKLRNVPVVVSSSVPTNRTKGSGSGVATLTLVLLVNGAHLIIAESGVMELATDSGGQYFAKDQTAMRCVLRTDFAVTQEKEQVLCDQLLVG